MGTRCYRLVTYDATQNCEAMSFISNDVKVTDSGGDQESAKTDEQTTLMLSLKPLVVSLRLFGIYFKTEASTDHGDVRTTTGERLPCSSQLDVKLKNRSAGRTQSLLALALLWSNIARCSTAFTSNDQFNAVFIYKVTIAAIDCLAAIMHTSYYIACRDGKLDAILQEITVGKSRARLLRRLAVWATVLAWLILVKDTFLVVYVDYFSKYKPGFLLAPFQTYISVGEIYFPLLLAFAIVRVVFTLPYVWFTFAMNQFITLGLYGELKKFNCRFQRAIDINGRFHGSIKQFRRQHQALCHTVKNADHFIRIGNVGGFVCHMIMVIFLLYNVMFHQFADAAFFYTLLMCLVLNDIFFILTTIDGIVVNHAAHKLGEVIHDIDLSLLNANELHELTMFQKRLTGNPIGFSVLGIFVINKSTVLSILGVLITYFLLVVQLSSPWKTDSCVVSPINETSTT